MGVIRGRLNSCKDSSYDVIELSSMLAGSALAEFVSLYALELQSYTLKLWVAALLPLRTLLLRFIFLLLVLEDTLETDGRDDY